MLKWLVGVVTGVVVVAAIGTGLALAVLPGQSKTTINTPEPAIVPAHVSAQPQADPPAIVVNWTDPIRPDTTATLQRSGAGADDAWQDLAALEVGATSYHDGAVTRGRTYHYRIQAQSSDGSAGVSISASATVPD